jgi:hypothetical protein
MAIFWEEFVRAVPGFLLTIITLMLGWAVGQRLTLYWSLRQKRKELDLSAADTFSGLYGEFFGIWKLWNYYLRGAAIESSQDAGKWDLLNRAARAEGQMEAMMVKLASQRSLTSDQIMTLGRFRQSYQHLRQAIASDEAIGWGSSEHPEYVEFKTLAAKVATIILSEGKNAALADEHVAALLKITSNEWDRRTRRGRNDE